MTAREDRNRRAVSIEQLLIWAYQDQMVHQARRLPAEIAKSSAPLAAYSSLWSEGAPVEASRSAGFDAADDAWRVHAEVMKLRAITVDCGQDLAASRYHALGQYRGAEPPMTGTATVDRTGRAWPTDGLLQIDLRMLVVIHASKATRPEQWAEADYRYKAGPLVRHPSQKGGVYQRGWYQHVTAIGTLPGDVRQAREVYAAWRAALVALVGLLRPIRLTMFSVTDRLPPTC